ncbi:ABC transporter permease [Microbispora sp. NEAU-D428]|uniref:ABC transporter permease n=1 Tax=Microbispora sitophila TaxID=2771537 RepID=UPI0018660909|nr:ABC transporter permease [Microbispora sitophila]MBE3013711.1 ABC transporter permease [Microbispora sitophila]
MTPEPTAVIHDIGYRHYDGVRLGRGRATLALGVQSLRGVFGLGRTVRAKIMPLLLAAIMLMPTVVSIGVMALAKQFIMPYPGYAVFMQAVIAIFLAAQSPYLVAPDLRFRVLPLYLSRPLTVTDYVLAKLTALAIALFGLLAVPLTIQFVGELLVDLPGPPHTADYLGALGGAVLYAVLLSSVGIALASFTPRRGLGVASVIAFYMFTAAVSGLFYAVLTVSGRDSVAPWALLLNPFFLVDSVQSALFGTEPSTGEGYPPGIASCLILLAVIALAVTGVLLRYRKAAS